MFNLFRSTRKFALAAFSALALAACDLPAPGLGGGPSINTSAPVPVALLVPSGSGQSGDDVLAQSLENAARLAMAELEGVTIDLRVYSTAGSAQQAAAQTSQAISDGARIILGPVYAEAANAAGVAAAARNINVLSFSNNASIAGGNVFVLGPTFQNTADRLIGYAGRQGKSNVVVVHSNDVAGQVGRNAVQSAAARSAVQVSATVPYELSQQSVISAIPQVTSAVRGSGADAIFLTATTSGALPLFAQLLPEAGLRNDEIQYIGLTRWDIPAQTLDLPGVQNGWFALPDPVLSQRFSQRYQAAYGGTPHPIAGLAFDGIAAIGALVANGQSNALTGAALTQSAGFSGVNGIFRLRPDGTNERGLAVATIQNKQVVVIDPAPRSFAGAGS
ncbi:penicillin-binding protein activator [Aestuariivita boseongensis]|uniref:penicillin-binding protein activator n=1 Tax=Aestuariivita boseongensis TaxID=1470562 RepID=UPI00067FEB1B|nr:penicillin-binding protein activator [Aestuariivita boseongensis]